MNSQFRISSSKESGMSQDVMSSPGSNGLFIEDREELNLGLLDESEEEEQVVTKISRLSDLVNTDNTRKRRPVLTEARVGGESKSERDPRLFNNRKLSRMSSGCVGLGATGTTTGEKFGIRSPDSSSSAGSRSSSQFQFQTVAGQHQHPGIKWRNPGLLPGRSRPNPPGSSLTSPQHSESPPVFKFGLSSRPAGEDQEIQRLEQDMVVGHKQLEMLKARKEARLVAEADLNLSQQRSRYQTGGQGEAGADLGPLALREIQKQTQMVLNMQKSLMMERQKFEEEKRRQEDQRKYQELQHSIESLQRQLQAKQGVQTAGSIKDRVGPKNEEKVSVFSRIKKQETPALKSVVHHSGFKRKLPGSAQGLGKKPRKKNNSANWKLPEDLVLTNLTAQGPRKARARIDFHRLPEELALTELTEDGPKPRVPKIKEDDDKVFMEEEELNRYEGKSGNIFD